MSDRFQLLATDYDGTIASQSVVDDETLVALSRLRDTGRKKWQRAVETAVAILQDAFWPTDTVLGGGNAKLLNRLPPGCRRSENQEAFIGANRLWEGADMVAEARGTSWLIRRRAAERGTFERGTRNAKRGK